MHGKGLIRAVKALSQSVRLMNFHFILYESSKDASRGSVKQVWRPRGHALSTKKGKMSWLRFWQKRDGTELRR